MSFVLGGVAMAERLFLVLRTKTALLRRDLSMESVNKADGTGDDVSKIDRIASNPAQPP